MELFSSVGVGFTRLTSCRSLLNKQQELAYSQPLLPETMADEAGDGTPCMVCQDPPKGDGRRRAVRHENNNGTNHCNILLCRKCCYKHNTSTSDNRTPPLVRANGCPICGSFHQWRYASGNDEGKTFTPVYGYLYDAQNIQTVVANLEEWNSLCNRHNTPDLIITVDDQVINLVEN